jgi:hypothetical protein
MLQLRAELILKIRNINKQLKTLEFGQQSRLLQVPKLLGCRRRPTPNGGQRMDVK